MLSAPREHSQLTYLSFPAPGFGGTSWHLLMNSRTVIPVSPRLRKPGQGTRSSSLSSNFQEEQVTAPELTCKLGYSDT